MTDVFTVSEMNGADLDEVVAIEALSHSPPKGRASFESDLGNPVARCWVLRQSDNIIGYLVLWVTDVVEIIDIAIAPRYRGRRLADRLLRRAFMAGARVLLEVRANNTAAQRLYERHGFERVGVRRAYYNDGEDAVLMARDVGAASLVRGLYPILSDDVFAVRDFAAAATLLAPRVSVMQLRFKESPDALALGVAREVVRALEGWSGLLVINDRADLLRLIEREGPTGLHVGQSDLPLAAARPLLPEGAVLGYSTHDPQQLRGALDGGAKAPGGPDYVAYGPVFATATKKDPDPVVGLEGLAAARSLVDACASGRTRPLLVAPPLVAIGGLDPERAALALQYADAVAVIGALFGGGLAELEQRLERFTQTLGAHA